jgi:hypothetical protein
MYLPTLARCRGTTAAAFTVTYQLATGNSTGTRWFHEVDSADGLGSDGRRARARRLTPPEPSRRQPRRQRSTPGELALHVRRAIAEESVGPAFCRAAGPVALTGDPAATTWARRTTPPVRSPRSRKNLAPRTRRGRGAQAVGVRLHVPATARRGDPPTGMRCTTLQVVHDKPRRVTGFVIVDTGSLDEPPSCACPRRGTDAMPSARAAAGRSVRRHPAEAEGACRGTPTLWASTDHPPLRSGRGWRTAASSPASTALTPPREAT